MPPAPTRGLRLAVAVALIQATVVACNAQSVTRLYDFSGKKAVQVMAVIRLTTAPGAVPLSEAPTPFVLNAYSVDARNLEVPLVARGQAPVLDLAVSVAGSRAEVPLVAVVPRQLQPGANGSYSLRFVATPTAGEGRGAGAGGAARASAQLLGVVDGSRLEALAGDVREGTGAADNTVEMSLATTLAVDLVRDPMQAGDGDAIYRAYRDIGALLHAQQTAVEGQLTAGKPLAATAYLKTVIAAIQAQVVGNVELQASVVAKINALAQPSSGGPALPALAQVAEVLAGWASSAQAALDPVAHPEAKAVPAAFLQAANSTQTAVSAATALTPLDVTFADTDASAKVAGTVTITPPRASAGISGYRVYFGGATRDTGRETLIGMAPAGQSPTLLVAAQSPPAGAGYMWIWPVSAGHELPCPYRLPLVNLGAPAARPAAPSPPALAAPAGLAVDGAGNNRLTLSWGEVAGATGYRVLYSPGAGFDAALSEQVDVPSGHTVTLTHLHNGMPYTIVVRALCGGLVGAMSAPVTGQAAEPLAPANVHVVSTDDGRVSLAWSAVAGATAYGVYWTPGAPVSKVDTSRAARPTPDFTHTGLDNSRTYHYAVAAIVDGEEGPLSDEITARPVQPFGPPNWVAARTLGPAQIRVSWPAVDGAAYYCLYHSSASPVALPTADVELVYTPDFTATNLPDHAVRFYAVASRDGDGNQTLLSPEIRGMVGGISPIHNRQNADIILGQSEHHLMQSGTDSALFAADSILGVAVAHSGALFVSDSGNNRVLGYPSLPTQDNMPALFAVNGAGLTTVPAQGYDYGHINHPIGLSATTALFVADTDNQRVVLHRPLPTSGPHLASAVIGVSGGVGPFIHDKMPTARDISRPVAVHAVGGRLLVADHTTHRVLIFSPLSGEPAPAASVVLGQTSMDGYLPNAAGQVTASTLYNPTSVWSDGERVLVADAGNFRVLLWNTFPTQNGQPADVVLGQASVAGGAPDAGSPGTVTGVGFGEPTNPSVEYLPGVSSNGTQIVVTDPGNFRVLVWDTFPTQNGTPADHVQGQNGLGDRAVPAMPNITSLHAPTPVYMDNQRIIVGDPAVPRVAIFGPYID